ncbi:MAG: DUF1292 domain-containing protein [Christensenellales bacterium]|jgi:recombinational DNA repair protein RecR
MDKKELDDMVKCGCGCEQEDCGCEDECGDEEDIITLTSEDGEQIDFYHEATIEYEGGTFLFLHPVEEMEEIGEDEVVIFKLVKNDDGEDALEPVEDEALLDRVYEEYVKFVESYDEESPIE